MHQKIALLILALLMITRLSGCMPNNTPQQHDATALLFAPDSFELSIALYDDPINCKRAHPLHSLLSTTKNEFKQIPANKPLTIRIITHNQFSSIPTIDNVTFIPQENQRYLVKRQQIKGPNFGYVVHILKEHQLKNGTILYFPVRYIKRKIGFFSDCIDNEMKENIKKISTSYQNE